jgi:hypothetical protein
MKRESPSRPSAVDIHSSPRNSITMSQGSELSDADNRSEKSHHSSAGLGPVISPNGGDRDIARRPSFGLKDTTPRRAPSIVVSDIKELIGDMGDLDENLNEDHFHGDDSDVDDDTDDDSDDPDGEVRDNPDKLNLNTNLEKLFIKVENIGYMQDTVTNVVNRHTEYLETISNQIHNKKSCCVSSGRWLGQTIHGLCDSFLILRILRDIYYILDSIPFIGKFLQFLCLCNILCALYFAIPTAISKTFLLPLINIFINVICYILFKPLVTCICMYYNVDSIGQLWKQQEQICAMM